MRQVCETVLEVIAGNAVLVFVADTCVTVTAVILFLLLIRPLMKKLPRIGMYVLWFMVLFRIVCPFTIHGIYAVVPEQMEQTAARMNSGRKVENAAARVRKARRAEVGGQKNHYRLGEETDRDVTAEDTSGQTVKEQIQAADAPHMSYKQEAEKRAGVKEQLAWILVLVWAFGVLVCEGIMICSLIRTSRKYKDAKCCFDNVYTHPLVVSSFVGGIFVPKIYVPENLSEDDRRYILCHERVHVRRRDYVLKPLSFCIFSLLWFDPAVWMAYHLMVRDMEVSCDEMAVQGFSEEERRQYSYLLLSMSGGEKRLVQNPAFSAGTVKERIVSVMKGKKMTGMVTALVAAAVALCSCGIASEPEETTVKDLPQEKESAVYVEQVCPDDVSKDIQVEGYTVSPSGDVALTPEGNPMMLLEIYEQPDELNYKYVKAVYESDVWTLKEEAWLEKWNEEAADKNYVIESYRYGEDGYLYVQCAEMSMPHTKFYTDREKYWDDFYYAHMHLFRIDEERNEITDIPLPEQSYEDAYSGSQEEDIRKGVALYDFCVFADGNVVMFPYVGNLTGIYSGVTGEKLADIEGMPDDIRMVPGMAAAGDGFLAFLSMDQESGNMQVNIVGEDGKMINTMPTHVKWDLEEGIIPRISTREDTIVLAANDGIYEAEPDSSSFTNVVNEEKDNLYYLTMDGYCIWDFIGIGKEDDYVLYLQDQNADIEAESSQMFKICRYSRSDATVIQ